MPDGAAGPPDGNPTGASGASRPAPGRGFDVVRRGYDRAQVDARLAHLATTVEVLHREAARARAVGDEASEEARSLRSELDRGRPTAEHVASRVGEILALADAEAEAVRADAARRAAEAAVECDRLVSEAKDYAERLVESARRDTAQLLEQAEQRLADAERARAAIVESIALAHAQLTGSATDTGRPRSRHAVASDTATIELPHVATPADHSTRSS